MVTCISTVLVCLIVEEETKLRLYYRARGLIIPLSTRRSVFLRYYLLEGVFLCIYSAVIFIFRWMNSSILLIVACLYEICCLMLLFFTSSLGILYFFEFLVLFLYNLFMLYVVFRLMYDIIYILICCCLSVLIVV